MAEERRTGHTEILDGLKDFKSEIKEDIKEIKDELKLIDTKIKDNVTSNNKFYFNGFEPHKHVADHHIIDNIIDQAQQNKKSTRSIVEKWVDRVAFAAITYIALSTWSSLGQDIQKIPAKIIAPEKVEQNANTPPHP